MVTKERKKKKTVHAIGSDSKHMIKISYESAMQLDERVTDRRVAVCLSLTVKRGFAIVWSHWWWGLLTVPRTENVERIRKNLALKWELAM